MGCLYLQAWRVDHRRRGLEPRKLIMSVLHGCSMGIRSFEDLQVMSLEDMQDLKMEHLPSPGLQNLWGLKALPSLDRSHQARRLLGTCSAWCLLQGLQCLQRGIQGRAEPLQNQGLL